MADGTKYKRGGGETCAVHGCTSNRRRLYLWKHNICTNHQIRHMDCPCALPYSLHIMPSDERLSLQWKAALQRKTLPKRVFVCSKHFVDGRPTKENGIPSIELGHDKIIKPGRRMLKRRLEETKDKSCYVGDSSVNATHSDNEDFEDNRDLGSGSVEINMDVSTQTHVSTFQHMSTQYDLMDIAPVDHLYGKSDAPLLTSQGTQTLKACCSKGVGCDTMDIKIESSMIVNDSVAMLYTGLSKEVFQKLICVMSNVENNFNFTMSVADQILLCLMRLRLNLLFSDLGFRFGISESQASKIFNSWIPVMSKKVGSLVLWLPRETIRATMPTAFKENYPKTTVIIDCAETFMQRPKNLKTRGETYSNYKSHNTVKYMVGISPHGQIMFISQGFGGRASDKFIVQKSGFLNYLLPGDEIMADRGFTINDLLFPLHVKLNVPAFTKGKQLSEEDTTETRRIAAVRIHIERAIRRLKVFKILSSIVPVTSVNKLDDILLVCAALVNLGNDLIKESVTVDLDNT